MSFYTSLTGLKNAQTSLGVISHNIANAETGGFKRSRSSFADIVPLSATADPTKTVGIGARVSAIRQEFSLGPIEQTGSALDLTISGEGFFAMRSPISGQTTVTRAGSFTMDGDGFLLNANGDRLQVFAVDASGNAAGGTTVDGRAAANNAAGAELAGVTIENNGLVYAAYDDGSAEPLGKIALANFTAPQGLKQLGSSSWEPTGISGPMLYGEPGDGRYGAILSGALERSNVDIAEELVGLITAQRNFQANAKAIDTATQISQTIINIRN